jgi:hypothetical protein
VNGQPDIPAALAYIDQGMKAWAAAKSALLGQGGAALLISTDLAVAEASAGNPYGSAEAPGGGGDPYCTTCDGDVRVRRDLDGGLVHAATWEKTGSAPHPVTLSWREKDTHGRYDAGSAAEVAEGADPTDIELCGARERAGWMCVRADGHEGPHEADGPTMANPLITWEDPRPLSPPLCPARWGEPPETMLCSLASGHDGCHATAEGIEWGGRWETAEPATQAERDLAAHQAITYPYTKREPERGAKDGAR